MIKQQPHERGAIQRDKSEELAEASSSTDLDPSSSRFATAPAIQARDGEIRTLQKQLKVLNEYISRQDATISSLDTKLLFATEHASTSESKASAAQARSRRLGREAETAARKQEEAEGHTKSVDRITTKAQRLLVVLRSTERERDAFRDELSEAKQLLASAEALKRAALQRAGESQADLLECRRLLQEARAVASLGGADDDQQDELSDAPSANGGDTSRATGGDKLGGNTRLDRSQINMETGIASNQAAAGDEEGSEREPTWAGHDDQQARAPLPDEQTRTDARVSECSSCAQVKEKCIALQRLLDEQKRRYYELQQRALLAIDAESQLHDRAEGAELELRELRRTFAASESELEREKAQRRADAAASVTSLAGLREEALDLDAALRDRREEIKKLRSAVGSMGSGASRLREKEERRESEIARLRAACHRLRGEAVASAAEVHRLRGEAQAERLRGSSAAREAASLRSELEAAASRAAEAQRGARLTRASAEATAAQLGAPLHRKPVSRMDCRPHNADIDYQKLSNYAQGTHGLPFDPLESLRGISDAAEVAAAVEGVFVGALGESPQAKLLALAGSGLAREQSRETVGDVSTTAILQAVDAPSVAACWALLGQAAADGVRGDRAAVRATRRRAAAVLARLAYTAREAVTRLTLSSLSASGTDAVFSTRGFASVGSHLEPLMKLPLESGARWSGGIGATAASIPSGQLPVAAMLFGHTYAPYPRTNGEDDAARLGSSGNTSGGVMPDAADDSDYGPKKSSARPSDSHQDKIGGISAGAGEIGRALGPRCLHASALALGDDGLESILGALGAAANGKNAIVQRNDSDRDVGEYSNYKSVLDVLDLRYNGISDAGASAIAGMRACSPDRLPGSAVHRWRLVDLRGNRLTTLGVRALAEALRDCGESMGVRHVLVGSDGMLRGLGQLNGPVGETASEQGAAHGTAALVAVIDCREQRPKYEAAAEGAGTLSNAVTGTGAGTGTGTGVGTGSKTAGEQGEVAVLHRIPEEDSSALLSARLGSRSNSQQIQIQPRSGREAGASSGSGSGSGSGWNGDAGAGAGVEAGGRGMESSTDDPFTFGSPYRVPPAVLPPVRASTIPSWGTRHAVSAGTLDVGAGGSGSSGSTLRSIEEAIASLAESTDPRDAIRAADLAMGAGAKTT